MQMAKDLLLLFASEQNRGQINRGIALYCLAHFDEVLDMNITQLAAACHVSPATITRFCRALGYDDFLHFKDECALDSRLRATDPYYSGCLFGDEEKAMVGPALESSCRELGRDVFACLDGVDLAAMRRLARDISRASDVLLLGMDFSSLMMLYLQRELMKRGKICRVLLSTANLRDVDLGPQTLMLMLSMNGCGLDAMADAVARLAGRCGAFWVLTQDPDAVKAYPFVSNIVSAGAAKGHAFHRYAELALVDMLLACCTELPRPGTNPLPAPQGHGIL